MRAVLTRILADDSTKPTRGGGQPSPLFTPLNRISCLGKLRPKPVQNKNNLPNGSLVSRWNRLLVLLIVYNQIPGHACVTYNSFITMNKIFLLNLRCSVLFPSLECLPYPVKVLPYTYSTNFEESVLPKISLLLRLLIQIHLFTLLTRELRYHISQLFLKNIKSACKNKYLTWNMK